MKKISIILLGALLLLSACAQNSVSQTPETHEPLSYTIYCDSPQTLDLIAQDATAQEQEKLQFKSAAELDFDHRRKGDFMQADTAKTKPLKVAQYNQTLTHTFSYESSLVNSSLDSVKKLGSCEIYESEDGVIAHYRSNGDLLFITKLGSEVIRGDLTAEAAQETALQYLNTLYGAESIAQYQHDRTSVNENGYIYVYYTRYIQGFPTSDSISVTLHGNGDLLTVNARWYGVFAHLENTVTPKLIQAAMEALKQAVRFEIQQDEVTLAVGSDGKCYLQVYGSWNESAQTAPVYYINVN